jgi:luciferase-like monooxygenase
MKFGYFTLSDNHYDDNSRDANSFVADILDEAVYAEEVGLHSAWIGEHHFSTLGVLSCPDLVLANVAARTKRIVSGKFSKSRRRGWSWYAGDWAITGSFGEDAHHDQEAG